MSVQILRQIISVAHQGDSIEIGLFIESAKGPHRSPSPGSAPRSSSPTFDTEEPLRCSFHIAHRFGMQEPTSAPASTAEAQGPSQDLQMSPHSSRNQPYFKTLILRRLLQHVDAQLDTDVAVRGVFVGRCCVLSTILDRGSPSVVDPAVDLSLEDAVYLGYPAEVRVAHEPTLEQLTQFAESLRGRKVTLIAHSKGSFAQHLTSYLTAWGLDVSHVSTEPDAETIPESSERSAEGDIPTSSEGASSHASTTGSHFSEPFVLIDDNVPALRARLQKIRAEQAYPLNLQHRKRPSLASNHRPRSSPQVARVMGLTAAQPTQIPPQVVIVHYTSLANFKLVKDAVQSIITPGNSWTRIPEVIVIPKPAGPRRILTALHTAVTKPIVDPFFAPIATSPVSPSFHPMSPLFANGAQRSPGGRSTGSFRTTSDRSARSPKESVDSVSIAPSSPLGMMDNMEYFSDAVTKLGTSPSSGLVIQSPDGQPAGIFFHPKAKGKASAHTERGLNADHAIGRPRGSSYRRPSDADETTRGTSIHATETLRRSPRPPQAQEVSPAEAYEGGAAAPPSKGKPRSESISEELETVLSPSEGPTPLSAPRLARKPTHDPRYSPPLSPQIRTPGGGTGTRRPMKRPTVETVASAPAAIPKKGTRGGDTTIVPPISVLIVDGKWSVLPSFHRSNSFVTSR